MKVSTPFNHLIPKDLKGNLEWRRDVMKRVIEDPKAAEFYKAACEADPLFFINGFCWTHDPRLDFSTKVPFILYPYQEEAILEILSAINSYDLLIEKSRDTGASWCNLVAIWWCWRFRDGLAFLLGSRIEDDVDKQGKPKSLFWKLDYIMENLPAWLRPAGYTPSLHRSKLHVENPETGSVIDGESTTIDFARGARCTAILLDEFASVPDGQKIMTATRDATKCRLFNSTPKGTNNAFYSIKQKGDIKTLRMHWSRHPLKAAGLYTVDENGLLKVLDPAGYPLDYKPILDGKLRSPWYDNECRRAESLQEIAQELDIDYLGSGCQFFNAAKIEAVILKNARAAILVGELEYDQETCDPIRFTECAGGHLQLWVTLDRNGKPSIEHPYSQGHDISAGTGASNSCIAGYDTITCTKAYQYVNAYVRPEDFARQSVAIAKWFGDAFMIWGSGGVGRQFGSRVVDSGYGNFAMRKQEEALSHKQSDIPGLVETKEVKLMFVGEYRNALERFLCINYDRESMEETLEYIFGADGGVEHAREKNKLDPSGAKDNHGDRVIADALAWRGVRERAVSPERIPKQVPIGCLKWRNEMRDRMKNRNNNNNGW